MRVLLKGMEMPTAEQGVRTINIYADGVVTNYAEETIATAIPVKAHGRLIDADALFDIILNIYKVAQGDARKAYSDVLDAIVASGAAIEAEEV